MGKNWSALPDSRAAQPHYIHDICCSLEKNKNLFIIYPNSCHVSAHWDGYIWVFLLYRWADTKTHSCSSLRLEGSESHLEDILHKAWTGLDGWCLWMCVCSSQLSRFWPEGLDPVWKQTVQFVDLLEKCLVCAYWVLDRFPDRPTHDC